MPEPFERASPSPSPRGREPRDPASTPVPKLRQNWVSFVGLLLSIAGATSSFLLLFLDIAPGESHAYPATNLIPSLSSLLVGGVLIVVGILIEAWRRGTGRPPSLPRPLSIDLSRIASRAVLGVVLATAAVTVCFLGVGFATSELYEYTESNAFCGQACHPVMEPEWVAFRHSPHARLHCVDCHVGPKVESYVTVKLRGLEQLSAVLAGRYERPVSTPIENLRPAREICEQCHWAGRFIEYKELVRSYYQADEANTPTRLRLLVKIGGRSNGFVGGSGIHYHMVAATRVEYVARDTQRQEIPWVRVTREDGSTRVYEDSDAPLTEDEQQQLETRTMDCLDCHNRPAHRFPAPTASVNRALEAGLIRRDLPFIKRQAVRALDADYASREEALRRIAGSLYGFYSERYPEIVRERPGDLEHAIRTVQAIFERSVFPAMRTRWSVHPDNLGHRDSAGCFRCHNDRMQSEEGDVLFRGCNSCHVILAQGENVEHIRTRVDVGEDFRHPEDGEVLDEYTDCIDCHTGGADLYE